MAVSSVLPGYPANVGSHPLAVFSHAGPSSYAQIVAVAGTVPVTGGDTLQATEAGLKYFDVVSEGVTDDGTFVVRAIPVSKSNQSGQPTATYKLKWIALVTATIGGQNQTVNTEAVAATNLSAEVVRLVATGY